MKNIETVKVLSSYEKVYLQNCHEMSIVIP